MRDPGAVGACFRAAAFAAIMPAISSGMAALADLRVPREVAGQAHVHVPIFVGKHPPRPFDFGLGDHGAGAHVGVDFIARAIQEARVDEDDPFLGGLNAAVNVVRRSSSMMPIFVFGASPSTASMREKRCTERATSSGPCCLGLTMIRCPRGCCVGTRPLQVCLAASAGSCHPQRFPGPLPQRP